MRLDCFVKHVLGYCTSENELSRDEQPFLSRQNEDPPTSLRIVNIS